MMKNQSDEMKPQKRTEGSPRYFDLAHRCMEISGVMFLALDTKGKIILINRRGREIIGYEEKDLIGKNWFDTCLPAGNREEVKRIFEKLIAKKSGPVEYWQNPILTKSGKERIIAWHNSIIEDGTGRVTGTLSSGEDITQQKRSEKALDKSETQYRLLAENISDVIWVRDMNFKPTYISPSVIKLRGYSVEEAMAQAIDESMTPDSADLARKVLKEEIAIERREKKDISRSRTIEVEMKCKDGSTVWVETKMSFLRDKDDEPIGILGVSHDIIERKRVQEEREKVISELQGVLQKLKILRDLIPICSSCRKIRNDKGEWQSVELFFKDNFEVEFKHEFCPDCAKR